MIDERRYERGDNSSDKLDDFLRVALGVGETLAETWRDGVVEVVVAGGTSLRSTPFLRTSLVEDFAF
jgi:hypothetical protein